MATLALYEPEAAATYPIELVERMTMIPRRMIAVYCRRGIVAPMRDPHLYGWFFDGHAIRRLREAERLRRDYGINWQGIQVILGLLTELNHVRGELDALRRSTSWGR